MGALLVGEGFGVALCASGDPLPGIFLMLATGAWWFYSARQSVEATNVGLSGALFGAIGLAPLVPFVAGFLLPVRDALLSTLYAIAVAILLAGLGSASMFSWDAFTFAPMPIDSSYNDVLLRVISQPSTWIMILACVLAALISSLMCGIGKRVWCVIGSTVLGVFLTSVALPGRTIRGYEE